MMKHLKYLKTCFNGYDDAGQINDSAVLKCRLEKILLADEYSVWVRVRALKVLSLLGISGV